MSALFLYAVFFLSGVCGLGYQMVWSRMFAIGLGHELPGVLAVVAAFFAGLALGAWTLDRTVSRSLRPGRWYGGLEILIGCWGLISVALIPHFNGLAPKLIGLDPSAFRHWAVAFAVPFFVLLPATTAMGATFPAMERFAAPLEEDRRCVGKLCAANTLGAVVGTLASTFVVVPAFGFMVTLMILAGLNLVCGVAACALERGMQIRGAEVSQRPVGQPKRLSIPSGRSADATGQWPAPPVPDPDLPAAGLNLTVFVTGLLGIGYEVLGVRVLAEVLENTIYTFAAALSVYLLGTALGAGCYQRLGRRAGFQPALEVLLCGISTACVLGALMLSRAQAIYDGVRGAFGNSLTGGLLAEATVAALVFGMPTILMGAAYSHLVQWARREEGGVGGAVALNTLGSALAPILFGVVLLPALGAKWSLVIVSLAYLLLMAVSVVAKAGTKFPLEIINRKPKIGDEVRASSRRLPRMAGWKGLGLVLPVGLVFLLPARLQFVQKPPRGAILEYRQGVMDSVAVVRHFDGNRSLLVNNRFIMGGTGAANAARRHAQIPLLLHANPKRALFLGLGTAITFAAAGTHAGLKGDGVELVPEVLEVLHRFEPENALRPGLHLYAADARRFVRATEARYDVIVADLFHPARDGAGALYTVEHFQAIRDHLSPGGLFCQWLPLFQLDEPMFRAIVRTFLEVFPHTRAFLLRLNVDTPVLGLVATMEPALYPADWFDQRVRDAALVQELKPLTLTDRFQLFGLLVANAQALRDYSDRAPLNTDDRTVVIFGAPRFAYQRGGTSYGRLLALLDRGKAGARELIRVEGDPAGEKLANDLEQFIAARNVYLRGLVSESQGLVQAAIDAYVESARMSPDFSTGYAHCLTVAVQQAMKNPDAARALLQRLAEAQPARPVAGELLDRLFPGQKKSP